MSSNDGHNYRGELGPHAWDWTPLNDSFDRGIKVTDIDGYVEVNNHFLFIEGKSHKTMLPTGQRFALRRESRRAKSTVIVITGAPPDIIYGWFVRGEFANELEVRKYKGDYEAFAAFVRLWFQFADGRPS